MWSVHASDALSAVIGGGDVNLDIDATAFVQVGILVGLLVLLKPMLFDPMLKLFEERERRIEGNIVKARGIDKKSADAKAAYEAAMHTARVAGATEREKLRAEGLRQEADLLAGVRAETAAAAAAGRARAAAEFADARDQLGKDAAKLAQQVAGVVMGREVRS